MNRMTVIIIAGLLAACGSPEPKPGRAPRLPLNDCPKPRPEACSSDYNPVCAETRDGPQTFANGCTACTHRNVDGFYLGACREPEGEPDNDSSD